MNSLHRTEVRKLYEKVLNSFTMISSDIVDNPPKALTFDVFGTCVNWRATVVEVLINCAASKTASSSLSNDLPPPVRIRLSQLSDQDWGKFAQEWRNSYKIFTRNFNPEEDEWRDIDTHHKLSFIDLLKKWDLEGLYTSDEIDDLSQVWHFLDPWKDSSAGIKKLNTKFITSSLSNGNHSLQKDLNRHAQLGFQMLQSAEDFRAYKPHPSVYRGAARKVLGGIGGADLDMGDVAMVAAHLKDLEAARTAGMRTIYVERPQEEESKEGESKKEEKGTVYYEEAKTWVDMWVSGDEDGFVEVARRFGIV